MDLDGVGVRHCVPVDAKAGGLEEVGMVNRPRSADAACWLTSSRAAGLVAAEARPCGSDALDLACAAVRRRAPPVKRDAGRSPHQSVNDDFGTRCIFADGDVRGAAREVVAAISADFLLLVRQVANPITSFATEVVEEQHGVGEAVAR